MTDVINIFIVLIVVFLLFLAVDNNVTKDINKSKEYEQRLEYCFREEPRTKDCEFVLWRRENR